MFVVFFTIYYSVAIFERMPACYSLVHHRCQIYEVHCFSIALVHAIFWLVQIYMAYTCMACTAVNCTHTFKVGKLERDLPTHMTTRHVSNSIQLICFSAYLYLASHSPTCKHVINTSSFLFVLGSGAIGKLLLNAAKRKQV